MQGSVHRFDERTDEGTVLLDDGREQPFPAEVFRASALRHLRVGQRVSVEVDQDAAGGLVRKLWIVGIGDDQPIR